MIHSRMKHRMEHRARISNRLAALAAIVLLLSSAAGPAFTPGHNPGGHGETVQAQAVDSETGNLDAETITDMVGVSPPARAAKNFNISSLIFRF